LQALLYDIHGNLPALDAVIADAQAAGARQFILGGDYALAGAWPQETVKRLDKLKGPRIRGNTDRWLEDPSDAPGDDMMHRAIEYCRKQLGGKWTEKLFHLPVQTEIDGACVCHASPRSDMLTFMPEATEGDRQLLAGTRAEVVIFGHSHLQFTRETDDSHLLVNPGSVGLPFDGDRRAAYALWNGRRDFELRRVPYDSDRYAQEVRKRMSKQLGPNIDTLVRRVEQAAMVS
jgi:predicted phosphodiesterase